MFLYDNINDVGFIGASMEFTSSKLISYALSEKKPIPCKVRVIINRTMILIIYSTRIL